MCKSKYAGYAVQTRVKEFRQSLGLTQKELAARVGVARQTIGNIEKGRSNPSILVCMRIAAALHTSLDWIFVEEISNG